MGYIFMFLSGIFTGIGGSVLLFGQPDKMLIGIGIAAIASFIFALQKNLKV